MCRLYVLNGKFSNFPTVETSMKKNMNSRLYEKEAMIKSKDHRPINPEWIRTAAKQDMDKAGQGSCTSKTPHPHQLAYRAKEARGVT